MLRGESRGGPDSRNRDDSTKVHLGIPSIQQSQSVPKIREDTVPKKVGGIHQFPQRSGGDLPPAHKSQTAAE